MHGYLYILRYRAVCVLQLFVYPGCEVRDFEINLSNWAVFSTWPESHDKNLNILRTKRAFKVEIKSIFQNFQRTFCYQKLSHTLECSFNSWDIGQCLYCKCLLTRLWRYFEINLIFLIKPFFLYDEKEKTKTLKILRTKRAFKKKWIAFFIIFEGLSLRQIEKMEGESPTLIENHLPL